MAVAEEDDDGRWMRLESAILVREGGRGREVKDRLNPRQLEALMWLAREELDRVLTWRRAVG